MSSPRIIIGIAGNPGSGKTAIAKYLAAKYGFFHFEGSDYLRQVATARNVELKTRKDYSGFHRLLQQENGLSVLADYLLSREETKLVFSGIRSIYNAQKIKDNGGIIIALEAPIEVRFARIDHSGLKYEKDLDNFKKNEESQYASTDHLGADLSATMKLADITLDTNKPIGETSQEIDRIIDHLENEKTT